MANSNIFAKRQWAWLPVIAAAFVGGAAYHSWHDNRALRDAPCYGRAWSPTVGDFVNFRLDIQQCVKMGPQKTFSGIYVDEFEGQTFHPDGFRPSKFADGSKTWLAVDEHGRELIYQFAGARNDVSDVDLPRRFHVTFNGSMSAEKGHYGHLGGFDNVIAVGRILSAEEMPPTGVRR